MTTSGQPSVIRMVRIEPGHARAATTMAAASRRSEAAPARLGQDATTGHGSGASASPEQAGLHAVQDAIADDMLFDFDIGLA
ncbi:hypothetical protein [Methylobacterium radiotolerans]|jgi:hypothetical protein|uniref:hypothetical protein n=1 Tax=Methylobacterium radiotolerans TaxID=31998 RepID=UPI0011BD66FE|nr:hypothetical protein [Methylobacterium radiotolerans]